MDIFEEVEKLNLPTGEFVVLGSGIMGALGIREIGDVDLLIKPELFEQLRQEGWDYKVIEIEGRPKDMIYKGDIQAFKDFWWDGGSLDPEEGIAKAENINGVLFIPIKTLLEVKKSMNREKDIRDVALIEQYLQQQNP
jgi:hypothetical protein